MSIWGMSLSIYKSYLDSKSKNEIVKADNAAKKRQYRENKQITSSMLSSLDAKVQRGKSEAVRQAIKDKLAVSRAGRKAEGQALVAAAQSGAGGKRSWHDTVRGIDRQEADAISDANINLETDFINLTEHHNDTARQMIQQLNAGRPVFQSGESTLATLGQATAAGLNYYDGLSDVGKVEFKDDITGSYDKLKGLFDEPAYVHHRGDGIR